VRTIVSQVLGTDSITFRFDDGSVVWVCFRPATVVDANARIIARMVAQQFLNNLNPTGRWGRNIDRAGNTESLQSNCRYANRIPNWIQALVAAILVILMLQSLLTLRCVLREWADGLLGV
jgi:hypothetical protein